MPCRYKCLLPSTNWLHMQLNIFNDIHPPYLLEAVPTPSPPPAPAPTGAVCVATATYVWGDLHSNCDTACATYATGKDCLPDCMVALITQVPREF